MAPLKWPYNFPGAPRANHRHHQALQPPLAFSPRLAMVPLARMGLAG
jgi:hypothetical protein